MKIKLNLFMTYFVKLRKTTAVKQWI